MALADIIARLRLNAQGFSTELTRELSQAERRFGQSGSVIGRNLSTGINAGLQDATSRIPVLGGALSGLSGPALGAAAGVGAIALALANGVREAEALQQEVRRLDGVLRATGNNTGFDSGALVAFAEQMEGSWAVAAEEIIRAQGTLATFDNVSGPVFQRAIEYAADLSAAFGTDLASNAQNLGQALQNLGNGDVEGLNRGFRFLGTETLNTIRTLAEAGQTAEAQEALFAALERRVGGSSEAAGQGLTGALFRLKDAAGDLTRTFAESTGTYSALTSFVDGLAASVNTLADRFSRMSTDEAVAEGLAMLTALQVGGLPGLGLRQQFVGWMGTGAGGPSSPSARESESAGIIQAARAQISGRLSPASRMERGGGVWPVQGRITDGMGIRTNPITHRQQFHNGVDIAAPAGTPVRARYDGVVEEVAIDGLSGRFVRIVHAGNRGTSYAHLSRQDVTRGQRVSAGDVIGAVGSTGRSTGPHLHFRETVNGQNVNPLTEGRRVANRDAERAELGSIDRRLSGEDRAAQEATRAAERARQQAEREAEQRTTILRTGQQANEQAREGSRIAEMRLRGLEHEADLEEGLARVRREYEDRLERMPESRRAAEAAVTNGLAEQLAIYERQATEYAALVQQGAEQGRLTDEQRVAQEQAAAAMDATRQSAIGMAATLADQREVAEALVTAEERRNTAQETGTAAGERRAEMERKALDQREEAERHIAEIKQQAYEREREQVAELAGLWEQLFTDGVDGLWDSFQRQGLRAISEVAAQWTLSVLSGQRPDFGLLSQSMTGGSMGPIGTLLGGLLGGGKGGGVAAGGGGMGGLEGLLGSAGGGVSWAAGAAKGAGGLLGGIGGALGTAMPYVGAALAAFSLIQSLGVLKSSKRGSTSLGFEGGELGAGATRGNSRDFIAASSSAMGTVASSLARIAETLGGEITGSGSVSLGQRDGKWRGDASGRGITKTKKGAIDFGEDQEAAVRWAISEALRDGVVGGISDAAKRILQAGGDLEKAITKAAMIEEIPKLLKARLDPVGSALDGLNAKWDKTIAALKEGGATAEQMAEAQQLYKLELEDTIKQADGAANSLKEFLQGLRTGSGSPYSLRQQEEEAQAALKPFLDKINSGEAIDQSAYQDAAQSFLDIERQLYGSTDKFFTAFDTITAATAKAIERIDNATPIRTFADPFIEETASNTATMADQLTSIQQILLNMSSGGGSSGGPGFIGGGAGFANNSNVAAA